MKNSLKQKMVYHRLFVIAKLNNFESDEIKETIRSIAKKGLELEFLVEFDFCVGFDAINQMLDRVAFYNKIQKEFKRIVESEEQ
jgi:hypothetical protein